MRACESYVPGSRLRLVASLGWCEYSNLFSLDLALGPLGKAARDQSVEGLPHDRTSAHRARFSWNCMLLVLPA